MPDDQRLLSKGVILPITKDYYWLIKPGRGKGSMPGDQKTNDFINPMTEGNIAKKMIGPIAKVLLKTLSRTQNKSIGRRA